MLDEILGHYKIEKQELDPGLLKDPSLIKLASASTAPSWYVIYTNDSYYPGGRHVIALVDSHIGAIGMVVGMNYVTAIVEGDPAKITAAHDAIQTFVASIP